MSTKLRLAATAVAATIAMTLGATVANPAQAAPDPATVTTAAELQAEAEAFAAAAVRLERSIVRAKDGTLSIQTTAAKAGVNQEAFNQVAASVEVVNQAVRTREWRTTADLQVWPVAYNAHNGTIVRWWGIEVHLTAAAVSRIVGLLTAGAGLATIAAALTIYLGGTGVIPGIAAGLLALGAGVLQACANGNGVKFYKPHVGPPWCTGH